MAREITWLPAVENKGEGIFFSSVGNERGVGATAGRSGSRPEADGRLDCWTTEHHGSHRKFPGLPTSFCTRSRTVDYGRRPGMCYPASSIGERIYALPSIGYGLLLHTGSSDAEGTLGGLIEVGRRIHEHIQAALELGELWLERSRLRAA